MDYRIDPNIRQVFFPRTKSEKEGRLIFGVSTPNECSPRETPSTRVQERERWRDTENNSNKVDQKLINKRGEVTMPI